MSDRIAQPLLNLWRGLDLDGREKRRREAYRALFQSPIGRTVLADMIVASGFIASSAPQTDPNVIAFREGARWWMGEILRAAGIEAAPLAAAIIEDDLSLPTGDEHNGA